MSKETTIFDVLDNYFESDRYPSPDKLNFGQIRELRNHILKFYEAFKFIPRKDYETRIFLGSFLSSPPITIQHEPYLSSALLCADSVVLFDPLHYWFCDGQYERERLMSAPEGWRDSRTRQPNYERTKQFMKVALEWYSEVRILVESEIVILIPAENIIQNKIQQIQQLGESIPKRLNPLWELSNTFQPEEITVDDNQKGAFILAGGEKEYQIEKHLKRGALHFSRDIAISNDTGSLYTAPFRWEQFLGQKTLNGFLKPNELALMLAAISSGDLPLLANLTPKIITEIHKDSGFASFRAGLVETFKNIDSEIGTAKFTEQVSKIEHDILFPKVEAIHHEVKSRKFRKATQAIEEGIFTFTQTFLGNLPTGLDLEKNIIASSITGGSSILRQIFTKASKSPDKRIWMELIPKNPTAKLYSPHLSLLKSEVVGWDIDDQPSMKIKISAGILKK